MLKKPTLNEWGKISGIILALATAIGLCKTLVYSSPNPKHEAYCEIIVKQASSILVHLGRKKEENEAFNTLAIGKSKVFTNEEVSEAAINFSKELDMPNISTERLNGYHNKITTACRKLVNP